MEHYEDLRRGTASEETLRILEEDLSKPASEVRKCLGLSGGEPAPMSRGVSPDDWDEGEVLNLIRPGSWEERDSSMKEVLRYATFAAAACVLVAVGALSGMALRGPRGPAPPTPNDFQWLVADAVAVPIPHQGAEQGTITVKPSGGFVVSKGQDYKLAIRSRHGGYVTIVRLDATQSDVRPRRGQPPISIKEGKSVIPGEFRPPSRPSTMLVIITEEPATEIVRTAFSKHPSSEEDLNRTLTEMSSLLKEAGLRWFEEGRATLEPSEVATDRGRGN
jgi:hypothetical protein